MVILHWDKLEIKAGPSKKTVNFIKKPTSFSYLLVFDG